MKELEMPICMLLQRIDCHPVFYRMTRNCTHRAFRRMQLANHSITELFEHIHHI